MANETTLPIPPALYDYVLYFECARKDWLPNAKKTTVSGDGGLMNLINWNSTYSFDPDDAGGKTLFGVTENAWKNYVKRYPSKGYSEDLNTMGRKGWLDQIEWFWNVNSSAGKCANYACAFAMFQMVWGGFTQKSQQKLLDTLIANADKKDYPFLTTGTRYRRIADATHAYSDPMVAYDYMRKAKSSYMYNISTPDRTNKKYRMGWMARNVLSFTPYGLYIPITVSGKSIGLKYESTLDEWENAVKQLVANNTKGYVKIMDWGASPESIEKIASNGYTSATQTYISTNNNSTSSGSYAGCGGVHQLGNYSNAPSANIIVQQSQNREEVLNTLVGGSYTPDEVKKCAELISSDKKKNPKPKSES